MDNTFRNLQWVDQRNSAARSVALGTFDGVHKGHRALLQAAIDSTPENGTSCVLTFDAPPEQYFSGKSAQLVSFEQKIELIKNFGIDEVAWLAFDRSIASVPADDFVDQLLVRTLKVKQVVCGFDFRFGKGRAGDVEFLRTKGLEHGFRVSEIKPVVGPEGTKISSTTIRNLITSGSVEAAATNLGYYPFYRGEVVKGAGRGRLLGFPTANLLIDSKLIIPGEGVYLTWCVLPDSSGVPAVTSIGKNPTFAGEIQTVEAFILDFSGDLYGQLIEIQFLSKLREIVRYDSSEELQRQIELDVASARELISRYHLQDARIVLR